jgi:hypothetical protein
MKKRLGKFEEGFRVFGELKGFLEFEGFKNGFF